MYVELNHNEINRLHLHILTKSTNDGDFRVCSYRDISFYYCYRSDTDVLIDNLYNVIFKTKRVDIIKYFNNDNVIDFNEYESTVFDEIDVKFSFDIRNVKEYKKFSNYDKLVKHICNIYFYLYDNNI